MNGNTENRAVSSLIGIGCGYVLMGLVFGLAFLLAWWIFGPKVITLWWSTVGAPVYRLNLSLLASATGAALPALTMGAALYALVLTAVRYVPARAMRRAVTKMRAFTPQTAELRHVRETLENVLTTQADRAASHAVEAGSAGESDSVTLGAVWGGCLLNLLWGLLSVPALTALAMAQFNALRSIYENHPAHASVAAVALRLEPESAGWIEPLRGATIAGSTLSAPSLLLVLALMALIVLRWLVSVMPVAAPAWPRGIPALAWLAALVGSAFCYFLLATATLYFMCALTAFLLITDVVATVLLRPLAAAAHGLWTRTRRRRPSG